MKVFVSSVFSNNGAVAVNLKINEELPPRITALGKTWLIKSGFHVQVLSRNHHILDHLGHGMAKLSKYGHLLSDLVNDGRAMAVRVNPMVYHVVKPYEKPEPHVRESLIVVCEISKATDFLDRLKTELGIDVGTVPLHITLYTLDRAGSSDGIGLLTDEDFLRFSKVVLPTDLPTELVSVLI